LRGAFGLAATPGADRFLIGLAALSLLSELAGDGALLCVVDDAHWLDRASADALLFAARRLESEGVVLLASAREDGFEAPGVPELSLGRLSREASRALLAERAPGLPPGLADRVLAEADGNPLALIELPAALAEDSRVPVFGGVPEHPATPPRHGSSPTPPGGRAARQPGRFWWRPQTDRDLGLVRRALCPVSPRRRPTAERSGLIAVDASAVAFRTRSSGRRLPGGDVRRTRARRWLRGWRCGPMSRTRPACLAPRSRRGRSDEQVAAL
jgi:hypothetical protein